MINLILQSTSTDIHEMLMEHTTAELLELLNYWKKFLKNRPQLISSCGSKVQKIANKNLPTRKHDRARALTHIVEDRKLARAWLDSLSADEFKVLEYLAWHDIQRVDILERVTGVSVTEYVKRYYSRTLVLRSNFAFLLMTSTYEYGDAKETTYVYLPFSLRYLFIKNSETHPHYRLNPTSPEKSGAELTCNFEQTAPNEFLTGAGFIRQGHMKTKKNGEPAAQGLADLKKVTGMKEFYPNGKRELKHLRASLMASFLTNVPDQKIKAGQAPHEILKTLFHKWIDSQYCVALLLPHLKFKYWHYDGYSNNIKPDLVDMLDYMEPGALYTAENMVDFMIFNYFPLEEIPIHSIQYNVRGKSFGNSDVNVTNRLNVGVFDHMITAPVVKAFLFLAATLGIVNIHYDLPVNPIFQRMNRPYLTPFDGIRAAGLTELGAFILGKTDKYSGTISEPTKSAVTLDTERLIITLSGHDPLLELTLEKCMEKLGKGRYRMTFDTLFRECTTKKQIKEQAQLFRKFGGGKLPATWKDFFAKAEMRIQPLKKEPDMAIFSVPDDPEMLRIISSDPKISDMVLKVQGRRIAIRSQDISKLKQRLKKYGYLMK